jgi:hypothetical protein
MMKATRIVAASHLALFLALTVQAFTSQNTILDCTNITLSNGASFEACATSNKTTPSPVQSNGTTLLEGNYSSVYEFYTGLVKGVNTTTLSPAELKAAAADIEVAVTQNEIGDCFIDVTVSGVTSMCRQCSVCDQDHYSVDCTSLEYGRMVICESTAFGSVFFPLRAKALGLNATCALQNSTTGCSGSTKVPAPSKAPASPLQSPTSTSAQTTASGGASRHKIWPVVRIGSVVSLLLVI